MLLFVLNTRSPPNSGSLFSPPDLAVSLPLPLRTCEELFGPAFTFLTVITAGPCPREWTPFCFVFWEVTVTTAIFLLGSARNAGSKTAPSDHAPEVSSLNSDLPRPFFPADPLLSRLACRLSMASLARALSDSLDPTPISDLDRGLEHSPPRELPAPPRWGAVPCATRPDPLALSFAVVNEDDRFLWMRCWVRPLVPEMLWDRCCPTLTADAPAELDCGGPFERPRAAALARRVSELKDVTRLCPVLPTCRCAALRTRSFQRPSSERVPPRPLALPCPLAGPGAPEPSM